MNNIKILSEKTGCGVIVAKKAMDICRYDIEIAFEFLKLKGQAVARYKNIDGRKIPWDNVDYYMEARKRVAERGNKKMKFYSEVTKEMYDTIEALQAAEEKVNLKAEREEDINEIFDLVKEASELEKKTLKKMADYDQKYGFGSVATDLLKKVGVDNKNFTFSFSPSPINKNRTTVDKDSFNDLLRDFLSK